VERGERRQDYEEGLRSELDRAVAVRLRGAEKAVASHLSGGLDSSSITATAARLLQAPGKVIAYTAAPPDDYALPARQNRVWNEWPHACAVAALYGNIEHVRIDSSGKSPVANLDRMFHAFERPYLNLCNGVWATSILADAASRGIPVLFTGAFANASLSWDGLGSLAHLLRSGRILPFTKAAWSLLQNGMPAAAVAARTLKPLMPDRLRTAISELRWGRRNLSDVAAVSLATATTAERDEIERLSDDPLQQRLQELRYVDLGNYRKGALGGWGVEIRDPAGDRRLVEFCLSIPPEHFLLGGLPRGLARRAFADRLPDMVTGERRYGYQGADWHEGLSAARPQLREEVDRIDCASGSDRIVDVERLKALAEAWPEDGWNTPDIIHKYRHALLRGVSAGHFYRKATRSNG
jgi:asparagine synthase (glutamine-hydrolysing)